MRRYPRFSPVLALFLCTAFLFLSSCAAVPSPAPSPAASAEATPIFRCCDDAGGGLKPLPLPHAAGGFHAYTHASAHSYAYRHTRAYGIPQAGYRPGEGNRAGEKAFGKSLQKVSLLDTKGVAAAMEAAYKPYVTPALLKAWQANPKKAPGPYGFPAHGRIESISSLLRRLRTTPIR